MACWRCAPSRAGRPPLQVGPPALRPSAPTNHPDQGRTTPMETRTRSIPSAAALVVAGHSITRIIKRNGSATICFGPEAEDTLLQFIRAKDHIDQQVEETPEARSGARCLIPPPRTRL